MLSSQRALAALQAKAGLPINAPSSNNVFSAAMDEFDRVMRSGEYGEALSSGCRTVQLCAGNRVTLVPHLPPVGFDFVLLLPRRRPAGG